MKVQIGLLVKENAYFAVQFLQTVNLVKLVMLLLLHHVLLAATLLTLLDHQSLPAQLVLEPVNHALVLVVLNVLMVTTKLVPQLLPVLHAMLVVLNHALLQKMQQSVSKDMELKNMVFAGNVIQLTTVKLVLNIKNVQLVLLDQLYKHQALPLLLQL